MATLIPPPRQGIRIYGVGAAKTGTHSVGGMFQKHVRSEHEADAERLITLHLSREKTGDHSELREFLRVRDRRRKMKIDASQVNLYLVDDLEALFSGNLYILTIRHPLEWLRSLIDDSMRRTVGDVWGRFRDYRFNSTEPFCAQEKVLEEHGLYTLRGYLSYWCDGIQRVVNRIPPERLFVVKTNKLESAGSELAKFCDFNETWAPTNNTHLFANPRRFGLLSQIDPDYLSDIISRNCGQLSEKMFPETTIAEAVAALHQNLEN